MSYNFKEHVNMEYIDFDAVLGKEQQQFLMENFNVHDVDALSREKYLELYEKLCDIEVDEVAKAAEISLKESDVSERGRIVADIATYMGNQFIEGGKRWNSAENN